MSGKPPVLFIHGLWLHPTSWEPWIEYVGEKGYSATAPGWPGDPATVEEARANPEAVAGHGIDDVVAHYAEVIAAMPEKPVLVGHSFGGMIAQRLLGEDRALGAVAIDRRRSRACCRCRSRRSGRPCRCSATRPTGIAPCR